MQLCRWQKLVVLGLVTCGSLGLIVTLSARTEKNDVDLNQIHWVVLSLIWLGIISVAILMWNFPSKYIRYEDSTNKHTGADRIDFLLEEFSLPAAIFIFGGGAVALRLFYLVADFQCSRYIEDRSLIVNILFNLSILLLFAVQVPFLAYMHQIKCMREAFVWHHVVLLIAAANIVTWAYEFIISTGVFHAFQRNTPKPNPDMNVEVSCLNHTSVFDLYTIENVEHILLPFTLEFLLASLEILFHVWMLAVKEDRSLVISGDVLARDKEATLEAAEVRHELPGALSEDRECDEEKNAALKYVVQVDVHACDDMTSSSPTDDEEIMEEHKARKAEAMPVSEGRVVMMSHDGAAFDHDDVEITKDQADGDVVGNRRASSAMYPVEETGDDHGDAVVMHSVNQSMETNRSRTIYKFLLTFVFNSHTALVVGVVTLTISQFYCVNINANPISADVNPVFPQLILPQGSFGVLGLASYMTQDEMLYTVRIPTFATRVFVAFNVLFCTIYCLAQFAINSQPMRTQSGSGRFHGANTILFLCCIANCVLHVGLIVTICKNDTFHDPGTRIWLALETIEAVLIPAQYFTQAFLIYISQQRRPSDHHRNYDSLQNCLSFLAMMNIMYWIMISFIEPTMIAVRFDSNHNEWAVVVKVLIPVCIYYRYVGAIMLVRVKRQILDADWSTRDG